MKLKQEYDERMAEYVCELLLYLKSQGVSGTSFIFFASCVYNFAVIENK